MPLYLVPLIVTLAIQIQVSLIVFTPPVLAPKAQFDIGVSAVAVGLITALIYLTSVPATLISSQILHRLGPIRVSQLCVLFTSFGMVLMVSASPFIVILGALIVGIGYGPITPASSAILANTVPKKFRGFIFSIKQSGVPLGGALAGLIVPPLMVLYGWQIAGLIIAIMGIILIFISCFFQKTIDLEGPKYFSNSHILAPLKLIFNDVRLKELALSSGVFSGMQMSLGTFLVVLLTQNTNFSITIAGGALSAAMVAGAIGRLFWGFVSDKFFSPRKVLGVLGLVMSCSAFLTTFISVAWSIPMVYIFAVVFGASAVGWNGVYLAAVANIVNPDKVGAATSGSLTVTYTGVVVLPILFWGVYSFTGSYSYPFAFIGMLSFYRGVLFLIPYDKK